MTGIVVVVDNIWRHYAWEFASQFVGTPIEQSVLFLDLMTHLKDANTVFEEKGYEIDLIENEPFIKALQLIHDTNGLHSWIIGLPEDQARLEKDIMSLTDDIYRNGGTRQQRSLLMELVDKHEMLVKSYDVVNKKNQFEKLGVSEIKSCDESTCDEHSHSHS